MTRLSGRSVWTGAPRMDHTGTTANRIYCRLFRSFRSGRMGSAQCSCGDWLRRTWKISSPFQQSSAEWDCAYQTNGLANDQTWKEDPVGRFSLVFHTHLTLHKSFPSLPHPAGCCKYRHYEVLALRMAKPQQFRYKSGVKPVSWNTKGTLWDLSCWFHLLG